MQKDSWAKKIVEAREEIWEEEARKPNPEKRMTVEDRKHEDELKSHEDNNVEDNEKASIENQVDEDLEANKEGR